MKPSNRLLKRYKGNPILTPDVLPETDAVYNCGATKFRDKYLLLISRVDCSHRASMHVALSDDGIHFQVREKPFIETATDSKFAKYDGWTIDPRITKIEDTYYIVYPSCSPHGVLGILGKTKDFETFERIEVISLPDNRCPVLFPEKINGYYVRLDRPMSFTKRGQLWISFSPDLIHWGRHRLLLEQGSWGGYKIGPACPPIKTHKGWLVIYHGVGESCAGCRYSLGCFLLDLQDPTKIIGRIPGYILTPEEPYELMGRVPNVVFSTGAIVEDTGELKLYYGAADTCICLATGEVEELVEACLAHRV